MSSQKAATLSALLQQKECQRIYLSLDAGNFRQAIQHADQLIKSGSTSQTLARALKALALYHTRDEAQAVKEVEAVLSSVHIAASDQSILSPLAFVLSRTGRKAKAADVFEAASKGRPGDLDLSVKAFQALLAIPDYLRAQQLAMRMSKAFSGPLSLAQSKKNGKLPVVGNPQCSSTRNRYFWWSMQAYVMLALETPQSQGATLALTLAQRMIQKHVSTDEGKFDEQSHEDLHLYINVLLAQAEGLHKDDQMNKWREALQLLQSGPGARIARKSLGLGQLKLDLLQRTADWSSLESEARRLIEGGERNWMTIEKWIEGVVGLAREDVNVAPKAIQMADDLVAKSGKQRDYPLLRLALHHELRQLPFSPDSDVFVNLVEDYFKTFGRKLCCFEDLQPFLDTLQPSESTQLLACEAISALDPSSSADTPTYTTEDDVIKALNAAKIRTRIASRCQSTTHDVGKTVKRLLSAFYASLPISAKFPKTVPRAGTDFVLMAAQLILDTSRSVGVLIHLASILTHAATATPASYALKVLCLRIYLMLGCPKEAKKLWADLKIRGIQNESLGWLWIGPRQDGILRDASAPVHQWKREVSKLYNEVENDRTTLVMAAFERGNYSSVTQFAEFTRRIEQSTQRQLLDLDTARLELQLVKDREVRSREIDKVLGKTRKNVAEGLLQQWDDAVLPSFCNEEVTSLVAATSREHSLDPTSNALLIRRQSQYLALLGRASSTPAATTKTDSDVEASGVDSDGDDGDDMESLAARIVARLSSGSFDDLEELVQSLLGKATTPSSSRLPWQDLSTTGLLLDLYLLFWHLRTASSASSAVGTKEVAKTETEAETEVGSKKAMILTRSLQGLRQALESLQVSLKQAEPLRLHDVDADDSDVHLPGDAAREKQKEEEEEENNDDDDTTNSGKPVQPKVQSVTRLLENILDSHKGGKGTREKVFKDIKDEVNRSRRAIMERIQGILDEFDLL